MLWVEDPGQIHFPLFWCHWATVSPYLWSGPAAFPLTSPEKPDSRWGNHGDVDLHYNVRGRQRTPHCPASETQGTHWGNATTGRWLHRGPSVLLFKERCPRHVLPSCPKQVKCAPNHWIMENMLRKKTSPTNRTILLPSFSLCESIGFKVQNTALKYSWSMCCASYASHGAGIP